MFSCEKVGPLVMTDPAPVALVIRMPVFEASCRLTLTELEAL